MVRRLLVLVLVVLTTACLSLQPSRVPIDTGIRNPVARELVLHGDTGFLYHERCRITEATSHIMEQTAGLLRVTVVYDLDFTDTWSIVSLRDKDLLVRAPVDAPYVTYEDTDDTKLLGVVANIEMGTFDPNVQKRIYIVADRLDSHDRFVHVVQHEMYHAFGLRHVDDEDAVMFYQVRVDHPANCIIKSDAEEVCRAISCDVSQLNYCS